MRRVLMLAALVCSFSGMARAFDVTGGHVGFQFGSLSVNSAPLSGENTAVSGGVDMAFGPDFSLSVALNAMNPPILLGAGDANVLSMQGTYQVSDAVALGVFADRYWARGSTFSTQIITHFGVEATAQIDPFSITAFVARGRNQVGVTSDAYGIDAGLTLDNGFDFSLFYRNEDVAGLTARQYGVHMGYLISRGSATPVYMTASVANADFTFGENRLFHLGITIPLGNSRPKGARFFHRHSPEVDIFSYVGRDTSPCTCP